MTYVVQEACVQCKYGDCVDVCPVECFYEDASMLVINPDECIDCSACEPVCPVQAIVPEDQAKPAWIAKAKQFAFPDAARRSKKSEVTRGPKWDPQVAGEA